MVHEGELEDANEQEDGPQSGFKGKRKSKKSKKKQSLKAAGEVAAVVEKVFANKKSSIKAIKISVEFNKSKSQLKKKNKRNMNIMTYTLKSDFDNKVDHQEYDPLEEDKGVKDKRSSQVNRTPGLSDSI